MKNSFHKSQIAEATKRLSADREPPQVGVHVMSEFIYCPRAGIIASEQKMDDRGSEFLPAPALGGIPTHEIDRIEAMLEELTALLRRYLVLFGAISVALFITAIFDPTLAMFAATAFVVGATISGRLYWWDKVKAYLYCKSRLLDARRAKPKEPNWELNAQQSIQWWELLKAGFDSRELNESLHDQSINVKGKPWRILRRAEMHVPVIRIKVDDYDPGSISQVKLRDQQRARMAAYSYLIETCQRGQADWVIVLFNRTDDGVAVPLGERHWKAFTDGVLDSRRQLRELQRNMRHRPSAADGQRACVRCHLGRPRRVGVRRTVLDGTTLPAYATSASNGKGTFHCTCGDRFENVPPHEDAKSLGLLDR